MPDQLPNINFDTDKLVVLHYPIGAGGKFIQSCLALHSKILFINENFSRRKMKGNFKTGLSFELAMWPFRKKLEVGEHIEYTCTNLAGFNSHHLEKDPRADEKMCNDFWKQLTNQDEFYFFMTEHCNANPFSRYPSRQTIVLKNYDWIMKPRRNISVDILCDDTPAGANNFDTFDMNSIKERTLFEREIFKIFDYLELADPETPILSDKLDELRRFFLKTYKIGFDRDDMPWRKTYTQNL